jgi:hypothetical protein
VGGGGWQAIPALAYLEMAEQYQSCILSKKVSKIMKSLIFNTLALALIVI